MTEQKKIDGRTKRALDMAIAKKQVSQESYRAVLAGRVGLDEAKAKGHHGAPASDTGRGHRDQKDARTEPRSASTEGGTYTPPQPASRISKDDRSRFCMCGCGRRTNGRFAIGHDARVKGWIIRAVREGTVDDALTEEQREYGEERDLFRQTRERMAEEERAKAERQAKGKSAAKRGGAK